MMFLIALKLNLLIKVTRFLLYTSFFIYFIIFLHLGVQEAIEVARKKNYDCFIAVGGGSVIDTAKVKAIE